LPELNLNYMMILIVPLPSDQKQTGWFMKILTVNDILRLIDIVGIESFFSRLIIALKQDFARWPAFYKSARHATHYAHGVIELMPCSDDSLYAFKYVNGHPGNTAEGRLSVIAIGQLSEVASGYPLMICEMTLLTAFRTAATGVLAASYLARPDSNVLAVIGTGAQSEFQVLGFNGVFPLRQIRFFDLDIGAMRKFARNLLAYPFELVPCRSIKEAVRDADIIVTATAAKKRQSLFALENIAPGTHIQAIGGDCPGKTELSHALLSAAKLVVEYIPQALVEGEVQQCDASHVHAELWELVGGHKPGRENAQEITVFDSVGFALEDFSVLRLVYELACMHHLGTDMPLIPDLDDPKDLFGLLSA
jgi:ornithine cyclodeaminase